ncbi:hypothetical protein CEQ15_22775 [Chryseobacterium indologenes]|uniref:hypothetical protein n=1 Tax=Chryseobacterium indologenes TaxID=253 RepID=UPI000B514BC4|nr:hypothetical protein [Chryseobacterium indologenes]ASE64085.1 hypothetical protein CEQ15_22775 [Chryseobacterium indologenes]
MGRKNTLILANQTIVFMKDVASFMILAIFPDLFIIKTSRRVRIHLYHFSKQSRYFFGVTDSGSIKFKRKRSNLQEEIRSQIMGLSFDRKKIGLSENNIKIQTKLQNAE